MIFFSTVFICFFAACQTKVPAKVQETFELKYPNENDPDWRIDRNGNYESHFKQHGKHYRADFSPEGKWIETERSIKKKELPKVVREILKSKYNDFKIVELEETLHFEKGLFYDVELKKDGKKQDVEFDKKGRILN